VVFEPNYWFGIDGVSDTNVKDEKLLEETTSGQNTKNNLSVDKMRLDTLSLFFRDRIIDEIDTVKDSTFDCIQENIEELYILLKKESSGQKRIAPSSILQSILLNLVDGDYL